MVALLATLPVPLGAQGTPPDSARRTRRDTTVTVPIPPRPDSIRVDSTGSVVPIPGDTTVRRDTIKAPLARAESPVLVDIGPPYRWDRAALFASGALTLTDLLERIPGMLSLRTGWINDPEGAAYLGDPAAVRIFYDGLELAPLDPRSGSAIDLTTIELWTLEEVAIERGAGDVRVYLRSLRTDRTTPQTRVDVSTGDEDTNLYRGFYGKRFFGGEALQLAFQQYSTNSPRLGGGGDQLSLLARTGVARGRWSIDLFATRASRSRSDRLRVDTGPRLAAEDSRRTTAYGRVAYGDVERTAFWAQVMAGALDFRETSPHRSAGTDFPTDTADTTRFRAQYVASVGVSRGPFRISATDRVHTVEGSIFNSPSARASVDARFLSVSLFGERNSLDSTVRVDAIGRLQPLLSFIAFSGAASLVRPDAATGRPQSINLRGEAAIRLFRLWLAGGVLYRDSTYMQAPSAFGGQLSPVLTGRVVGNYASVRGQLYKAIYADAYGVRWANAGYYRPQYESRSELFVDTRWLRRFPSGNFSFKLAGIFDYRGTTLFPVATAEGAESAVYLRPNRALSALLEIRIVNATLSYQLRNSIGLQYSTVPGFEMPRTVNFYGMRWDFAN